MIGTLRATAIAIAIGLAGAVFVGALIRALLHGVPPYDPVTLAGVASALLLVVVIATAPPATKALRTQPAELLKED